MSRPERAESAVQVGLMLAVGGLAGAGAFSRVVELAVAHGQPTWLAVADAAVIESMAISAGLEIRRRRRTGQPVRFVAAVLVAAVVLSLSAQVAQAERSAWGWTMAAVPALGFLVLAKIALSRTGGPAVPTVPAADLEAAEQRAADAAGRAVRAEVEAARLAAVLAVRDQEDQGEDRSPDEEHQEDWAEPDPLLPVAREVAAELAAAGRPLSRSALAAGLRARQEGVATGRASALLAAVRELEPA